MAWGTIMKAFPGTFPPDVFDAMPLCRYAETYALACRFLELEAEAMNQANTQE